MLSVSLCSSSGSFVHGYLIPFVRIVRNFLKSLWWSRRGARSFIGQYLDPHAAVLTFSEYKSEVGL